MTNPHPLTGAPHSCAVGDRVFIHIKGGEYSGRAYPDYTGWVTIVKCTRSKVKDMPVYRGDDDTGAAHFFTEWGLRHFEGLKAEAGNIADYLALDAVEDETVQRWVKMLRRYAE